MQYIRTQGDSIFSLQRSGDDTCTTANSKMDLTPTDIPGGEPFFVEGRR